MGLKNQTSSIVIKVRHSKLIKGITTLSNLSTTKKQQTRSWDIDGPYVKTAGAAVAARLDDLVLACD